MRVYAMNPGIIHKLMILNGVFKNEKLYKENSRPKELLIEYNNGEKYSIKLNDTKNLQVFNVKSKEKVENARIIIESVYPGTKWNDCCITKLGFIGEYSF